MSTRRDEIESAMLAEMASHEIEDTPENRLAFLEGLREGWMEDSDTSLEKSLYMLSLEFLISSTKHKIMFKNFKKS